MHVCILGAGVIGLSTAWALAQAGVRVTIVDAAPSPGQGASRSNGAQLSYRFVAPLASPETLLHLPGLLLERDGPLRVRPGLDPAFLRWGLGFLAACRPGAVRATIAAQLALAALSRRELDQHDFNFGRREAGKLVLYRDGAALRHAGPDTLGPAECLALEPALRVVATDLAGGVYTASEEVGDCGAFCDGLAARLPGVTWVMGARAAPVLRGGRLAAVQAGDDVIEADAFVLAFGSGAVAFGRAAGLRLPVYPLKGYSVTVHPNGPALRHSVTDLAAKIVYAPLGDAVRVAGIADMVGHSAVLDDRRLATLRRAARAMLDVAEGAPDQPWTGLRPATPSSRPLIGWSRVPGLFLNTGHGALGWTLACGSARLAADVLLGRPPPLDPALFAP